MTKKRVMDSGKRLEERNEKPIETTAAAQRMRRVVS